VTGNALTPGLEKVRVPLNAWGPPPGAADGGATASVEEAEYAAALKLAGLIAARAGADGLSRVWQAIHDHQAAYQPTGSGVSPEQATAAPDWRGLLDLFEGQTGKRFDDLLTELGAKRVGERYKHDASSGVLPEEVAVEWCQEWASKLQQ